VKRGYNAGKAFGRHSRVKSPKKKLKKNKNNNQKRAAGHSGVTKILRVTVGERELGATVGHE
jgi:hypothetical protein